MESGRAIRGGRPRKILLALALAALTQMAPAGVYAATRVARHGASVVDHRGSRNTDESYPASLPHDLRAKPVPLLLHEVIVTGTHIANIAPISPVTTVTAADIRDSGLPDIASAINALPQVFSGGNNPNVVVAGGVNGGASNLDTSTANLRGMGGGATLTLIDGHRLVGSGTLMSVDLSSVPTAAVERVDIETDGASAIYGSDAVAGVVNIILKKHYDGQHTEAYVGDTADGGLTQRYSQLFGRSFAHGHGDAMLGYQYQSTEKVLASQRRVSRMAGVTSSLQPQDKSHSLFLSSHYDLDRDIRGDLEGIYNHRTNLTRFDTEEQQGLEDQFWANGGLKFALAGHRTIGVDVTYSGDSSAAVDYTASYPMLGRRSDQNRMWEVSINGQGKVARLPGGRVVRMAVGGGVTRESFKTGSATASLPVVNAARRRTFAYVEEYIPIFPTSNARPGLRRLVLNVAGRFDRYSDFGSISVPKVQLAYSPVRSLVLSATWGRSFQPPTLVDLDLGQFVIRYPGALFGLPAGRQVLFVTGSNRNLRPQTAVTRTVSLQWSPAWQALRGLTAGVSYYDIDFTDGVIQPITDEAQALSNPLYAPFVVRQPDAALQNDVISSAAANYNLYGLPADPAAVQAMVFDTYANVAAQVIDGIDAKADYRRATGWGQLVVGGSGSWMRFDQRSLPGAALTQISGTIFNPPRFKSRARLSLDGRRWGVTMFLNYIAGESDNAVSPTSRVGSWATVDAQVRYAKERSHGVLRSIEAAVSIQNMFDRAPPSIPSAATIPPGIGFDADNYSALGRFVSLDVALKW